MGLQSYFNNKKKGSLSLYSYQNFFILNLYVNFVQFFYSKLIKYSKYVFLL